MKYLLVYINDGKKITQEFTHAYLAFESFEHISKQGLCVALYNII